MSLLILEPERAVGSIVLLRRSATLIIDDSVSLSQRELFMVLERALCEASLNAAVEASLILHDLGLDLNEVFSQAVGDGIVKYFPSFIDMKCELYVVKEGAVVTEILGTLGFFWVLITGS